LERTCSIIENGKRCGKPFLARGWCRKHYALFYRQGLIRPATPEERFWRQVRKTSGCWFWTGQPDSKGYGQMRVNGVKQLVHRFAYRLLVGPVPLGMTLDHVKANGCISTLCVKVIADEFGPAHLEAVTHRENMLRGQGFASRNASKTHCLNGHPFNAENTYIRRRDGQEHRECRACRRVRSITQPPSEGKP
jgi:hypothetical protein